MELEMALISPFNLERSTRISADAKRPGIRRPALRGAATACSEIAKLVEKQGALHRIYLEQKRRNLRDEWVSKHIVRSIAAISKQFSQRNLESICEALQGRERRHGARVLDLRDIGARHLHPSGELTLTETAAAA
jgi:hypothetical protein